MNAAHIAKKNDEAILGLDPDLRILSAAERALFTAWEDARKAKDFAAADGYRAELARRDLI